jgi:hypothetical protein
VAQTKSYLLVQGDAEKGADNELKMFKFQDQMILHTPTDYKPGTFKDRDPGIAFRYHRDNVIRDISRFLITIASVIKNLYQWRRRRSQGQHCCHHPFGQKGKLAEA